MTGLKIFSQLGNISAARLRKRGARNTLQDCNEVLNAFSSEKSPDEDSFILEFYNCFLDVLSEDIINCYNAAWRERGMSISQRRGTITLIPKITPKKLAADHFTKFGRQNIAVNDKTLFPRIENYHTQDTSSLTTEVSEDREGKTTKETTREERGGSHSLHPPPRFTPGKEYS